MISTPELSLAEHVSLRDYTKQQHHIKTMHHIAIYYLGCQTFVCCYILQSLEPAFFAMNALVIHIVEIRVQIALAAHEVRVQLPVWRPPAMLYWPY